MSDHPRIAVSTLRKWLEDVQRQLPPTKWSLLLLCYLSEIPFGQLEQLQDTADLYYKLIEKHHFTPDESFQLLIRRLSFLKEDGRNCIRALARYDLPQSESIPDLSSKLSPVSRLVECIVKTFVELNAVQQNRLVHYLAWEYLKTNYENLTFLELFSKLIQGQILGVYKTQPLIDGLKHVRTPPDALCHLRDYHEDLRLGDFEYSIEPVTIPEFLTPQPLVGRSGNGERFRRKGVGRPRTPSGDSTDAFYTCSSADVSVNYGETPVHPPHQAVSHSDSALVTAHGVIHPPDQEFEVVKHEHLTVSTNEEHTFDRRRGQGFLLHVPKGAVSSKNFTLEVKCGAVSQSSSEFIFSEGSKLVSGVYHITASRKLSKPVALQIQHCAIVKGDSKHTQLEVAIAGSTTGPPYRFKPYSGRNVRVFDTYIEVKLAHFCFLCCILRGLLRAINHPASIRYCGLICCLKSSKLTRTWEYNIVVIRNLQLYIMAIRNEYASAESVQELRVEFEEGGNALTLDNINVRGSTHTTTEGWHVATRWDPARIEKREADRFVPGRVIPRCCVLASCTSEGAAMETLRYVLEFSGTQTPKSYLLYRDAQSGQSTAEGAGKQIQEIDVSRVDDSPLGEQDLHCILLATTEVASRWKHIGDTFRLSPGTLETIRENHSDAETCLREVTLRWLRESGYDRWQYGPPSWRWVVEAVGSPAGGKNPKLARRIAAQHPRAGGELTRRIPARHPREIQDPEAEREIQDPEAGREDRRVNYRWPERAPLLADQDDTVTAIWPPQSGVQRSPKKAKCGFLIFGIVAVLLLIGSMAPLAVIHPSYSSTYLAYADNTSVTVSLGTVSTLWYSSVTIKQWEATGDNFHRTTVYIVPSSEVKHHECGASLFCPPGTFEMNTRGAGRVQDPIYLLQGTSFNYTLCLRNHHSYGTAKTFIFDSDTTINEFLNYTSDGYKSSVLHRNLLIANGTSESACTSIVFTSSHASYYYITTEITFDNRGGKAQRIDSMCYISAHLKCFNRSGYTDLCTLSEDSKTCDIYLLEFNNLTFPWVEDYTMLAFVEGGKLGPTTHFTVNVGKSWYVIVLPAVTFLFLSAVIAVASIPVIVLYRRRPSGH